MAFCDGVKWLWIDLDDTLIDFHANSRAALARLYAIEGLSARFATPDVWIDEYEKVNKPLWRQYAAGEIAMDELRLSRFLTPLLAAGYPEAEALAMARRYDTFYLDLLAQEKRTLPGAHDVLRLMRARGYKIGVLSNGFTEVQHRKIASAGLTQLIDVVVLSEDAGAPKPSPAIFGYAMERAGVSDPSRHAMVGDNAVADVGGAVAAGWRAVYFNPEGKEADLADNVAVIGSLHELAGLFTGR